MELTQLRSGGSGGSETLEIRSYKKQHCIGLGETARVGDRCNNEFFEFHKDCSRRSNISKLMEGGRSLKQEDEILSFVEHYYKDLYLNNTQVEENTEGAEYV